MIKCGDNMLYKDLVVYNTYQVIEEIGSGGMGVVYLAYHLNLEKYIVMKKIKGSYTDKAFIRNEVDILKKLHHPYLPQVYDFIEYESELYTIIDYIDGCDLSRYIENGYYFEESQLIKWFNQLCEVLEYLHSQNPPIIHTDIKPANIIITPEGNVCLIDFGISLNETETVKGLSENYSSPEQFYNVQNILNGNREYLVALDARTDIYSLGATFYHMMTGVKPNIRIQQPEISQYSLEYSEPLIEIIEKAMQYNPDDRFKSASHMKKAVVNMRKLDSRYKKYVLVQLVSSLLAGLMIVSGITMIYFGNKDVISGNYEAEYNSFLSLSDTGNYQSAIEKGRAIINNRGYDSIIADNTKAELYYAIGECFYESEDYVNAYEYYSRAVDSCKDDKKRETYERDSILALIKNGNLQSAEEHLTAVRQNYPNSASLVVIDAFLCYQKNDFESAIKLIDSNISSIGDTDNLYRAYIIKGDACRKINDLSGAVSAYEPACQINETVSSLRKLGNSCLALSDSYSGGNLKYLNKAKDCFETVYNNYYPTVDDIINLAQTYRLSDDYSKCLSFLNDYVSKNSVDDYRIYMQMAIAGDAMGDSNTISYCQKAHLIFSSNDNYEIKSSNDNEDITVMKNLYKKYCNSVW